jgi:hypothetical protein
VAAKLSTEIWDAKLEKWEIQASFETFDVFYDHAMKFRTDRGGSRLRVHIPGDFKLTSHERELMQKLRIERF